MMRARTSVIRPRAGFTLLEVLVAISILVIITSIVYASLSSVVTATEIARVSADEMRMRQFLARGFQLNFSTIVADPVFRDERYVLIGISEKGSRGAMDSVEFASSAPVIGGASPPGAFKRVYYGAVSNSPGAGDEEGAPVGAMKLESSEQMMLDPTMAEEYGTDFFGDGGGRPNTFGRDSSFGAGGLSGRSSRSFGDRGLSDRSSSKRGSDRTSDSSSRRSGKSSRKPSLPEGETGQSPGWNVPVDQFDVSFFDGYEWVEDWDSIEFGRMPWAVRIRLNYARSEEEYDADQEAGIDRDKDFDFETVLTIPIGAGLIPEEEKINNPAASRTTSRGNLFGDSNRDRNRDRGKDERKDRSSRSDRDRKTDSDRTSGFGRARSGTRGGGLF
jgi:prepilin-type N-terminal cleavage/methylation domain-containing protein